MFGQNPVAGRRTLSDGYLIKKIWFTIQGEGPFAGRPAIFVRFTGCNLRCTFCDTDFQGGEAYDLDALCEVLWEKMNEHRCPLLVFTGGEPMLQEVLVLADRLESDWTEGRLPAEHLPLPRPHVQVETAGTVWPAYPEEPTDDYFIDNLLGHNGVMTLVCSPKTPKVHPMIAKWCRHWKYIIKHGENSDVDGLPDFSTQSLTDYNRAPLFRPQGANPYKNIIYVQPCDEGADIDSGTATFAMDAPTQLNMREATEIAMKFGYALSIQIHKIVGAE